jgi:hypothetical protein
MKVSILGALLMFFVFNATAQAQDVGENGANRRVESPVRYGGVRGTFSEPSFNAKFTTSQTNNIDTPQMYVGLKGPFEVDAGLSWLPTLNSDGTKTDNPNHWYAFMRCALIYETEGATYQRLFVNGMPWFVNRGDLNRVKVQFWVRGNTTTGLTHLYLAITYNNTIYEKAKDITLPSSQIDVSVMQVKRVTAMTQKSGVSLDGSFLTGASFTEGEVERIMVSPTGTLVGDGVWSNWDTVGGYNDHFIPFGHYGETGINPIDPKQPWIIDCWSPHQRHNETSSLLYGLASNGATLFSNETVNIHMFKRVPVKATRSRNRRS